MRMYFKVRLGWKFVVFLYLCVFVQTFQLYFNVQFVALIIKVGWAYLPNNTKY